MVEQGLSKVKACSAVRLSRSAYYRPLRDQTVEDQPVIDALNELLERHPRWGFWLSYDALRLQQHPWNHKRVYRVYKALGQNMPRRKKRKLPDRPRQPLIAPEQMNQVWSLDFMSDALYCGKRFRTLNIIDDGVREILTIVIDTSLPGGRVVRTLEQISAWRGLPSALRLDNGPELVSQVLIDWCEEHGIELRYIQPGKPNQNAFVERFNRTYRYEVLDAYLFNSLTEVREITDEWVNQYNEERPHKSLGKIPPSWFRRKITAGSFSFKLSY